MINLRIKISLCLLAILLNNCRQPLQIEKGVSRPLAASRQENISGLLYELEFLIPSEINAPIPGKASISFSLENNKDELVLDFNESAEKIKYVGSESGEIEYRFQDDHIIIPSAYLAEGNNKIQIDFITGETSLNRNEEYLYTLFVPDRASTAFPCFDQPDMKARFELNLTIPSGWTAIANGKLVASHQDHSLVHLSFAPTEPLPTYLFAFACGIFDSISRTRGERSITLYHRERDPDKIRANVEVIFNQVFNSLSWLEDYTGIPYPFSKYDLIAIPSFQYGGMEHAGAVLYRSSRIFLDESATVNQKLNRANLIAHETAHMWFGDLVTMKWFDEVWLKEVFANFMADKIVNPEFPEINHRLKFLFAHYPSAYSVDRTKGANPIIQELENLKNAGTVYGDIIYHKAPIVMKHLEMLAGEEKLQEGIRKYLDQYAYSNASWDELIEILEETSGLKLQSWNNTWIYEEGMPVITSEFQLDATDHLSSLRIEQSDPFDKKRRWMQSFDIRIKTSEGTLTHPIRLEGKYYRHNYDQQYAAPLYIIPNGSGLAYGYFKLDTASLNYLLGNIHSIPNSLLRGAAWLDLYENFLNKRISPTEFLPALSVSIKEETEELIVNENLAMLRTLFWRILSQQERLESAGELESLLWNQLQSRPGHMKYYFFSAYTDLVMTDQGNEKIRKLWADEISIDGLSLSERDKIDLCLALAIRDHHQAEEIYQKQLSGTKDKERRERLVFVYPACSSTDGICDNFFEQIKDPANREKEPWVISALGYLNHPMRNESNIRYLKPSLEMLQEIQLSGDIFFPKNWLDASLGGYSSSEAADIADSFIDTHPDYPDYLKLKILQSADMLVRASHINNN